MSKIKYILAALLCFLITINPLSAADFPTGKLKGLGFKVEIGGRQLTDKDMYVYKSYAVFEKLSENKVQISITANMQKRYNTPLVTDKRLDVFEIKWQTKNTGLLINKNNVYSGDKSSFTIKDGKITIKSWIARNQLWETQIYKLGE